jgi:hypothetical protein
MCLTFVCLLAHAQGGYLSVATVQFDVNYQPGVTKEDAQRVADYLQKDYSYLSDKLRLEFKKKVEVRIYDSVGKFLAEINQKNPWRTVLYWKGVLHVQPVQALIQRKVFEQSLSYELARGLLDQAVGKGCPQWLREAYAVYHCGEMAGLTPAYGAKLGSFADLDQDIQEYPNPPQRNDVHFILGRTMKFLLERYGEDKTMDIFRAFDGTTPVEGVFKRVFHEDFSKVEKAWSAHIASVTKSLKK